MGFGQAPLFTCQRKMFSPIARPLTALVGEEGLAITPAPLTRVHWPTAGMIRLLPAKVVLVVGVQSC